MFLPLMAEFAPRPANIPHLAFNNAAGFGPTYQDSTKKQNETDVRMMLGQAHVSDFNLLPSKKDDNSSEEATGEDFNVAHFQSCARVRCLHINGIFSLKGIVDFDSCPNQIEQEKAINLSKWILSGDKLNDPPQLDNSISTTNTFSPQGMLSNNSSPAIWERPLYTSDVFSCKQSQSAEIRFHQDSSPLLKPSNQNPRIPVHIRKKESRPTLSKETKHAPSLPYNKLHHDNPHHYKCQICGHEFNQKGNLYTHMRIHEDKRPFQCADCGYAARQMVQLKRHAKHHTFRFQFKCRFCSYSSKMKSTTTKHCMLVHGDLLKALNLEEYV